ncbi:MAG: HAMP domain-containing sensor histidine kinase [Acidimicrobiales bacterium]
MTLRRRLVATMVGVVAVGLIVVDLFTLTSLHSFLYGRVDSQLTAAAHEVADLTVRAQSRHRPITATEIRERVSPDVYVELLDPKGVPVVVKPSGSSLQADPKPDLPDPLPVRPLAPDYDLDSPAQVYRPADSAVTVGSFHKSERDRSVVGPPQYRVLAVPLPGLTLVVATRLDSVTATLNSLRAIELGLTISLLVLLAILITAILRRGLRPLEDMSREADAIAAGDLTRRVHPGDGTTEISRLGRALNGMLAQIETAFAQRATSEERLRNFLADASHELRTPLTSIQGYAELLRKDALPDAAARDRALVRIEQEAARMGVLVGDLSVLAREGEGPTPELVRVDLVGVVSEVVRDARVIDGSRTIELDCPQAVPVLGDPAQLEQLVHNLVGNALAHTPAGTPVEVGVWIDGARAVLEVRDHGPGMDAAQAARVFDRFYRGSSASRGSGSGLGLFIVSSLARAFGGEASVRSSPGEGSTFTVVLPVEDGATPPAPPATGRRSLWSRPTGGGTPGPTPEAGGADPGGAPAVPDSRTGRR